MTRPAPAEPHEPLRPDAGFAIELTSQASSPYRCCRIVSIALVLALVGRLGAQPLADDRTSTSIPVVQSEDTKIGPGVRETLASEGSVRVLIALETPDPLKKPSRSRFGDIRRRVEQTQNSVLGTLTSADHRIGRRFKLVPGFATRIQTAVALDRLERNPLVTRVDLDTRMTATLAESVPHIRADSMHAHGYTGEGVVVAILDTGIDTDHPDLVDDLLHEECFVSDMACPNGLDRQSGAGAAEDDAGHGTHVAGTITSSGIVSSIGVAPDAQIVAVKVLDSGGSGWASDIIAALDWVLDNRPDVRLVNMSLGGGWSSGECDLEDAVTTGFSVVINALRAVGVTTFASSGNDYSSTRMGAPACVSGAVSVGAVNDVDVIPDFSNTNAYTDLLAPGSGIIADLPGGTVGSKSGTSMASPHAVGCAALQLEANRATTPGSLESWLKTTGIPVVDSRNGLTFPRIDCFAEPTFGPPGPSNDNLTGAVPIGALPFSTSGTTVGATYEPSEAFGSCSSDHGNSVWWSFTAAETRRYEVNTNGSSINTGLSVWSGSSHPLSELACDDDGGLFVASKLRFDATAGEEYFIRVIGTAGADGSVSLSVLVPTLPANDDADDAIVIDTLPAAVGGSNVGASMEPAEQLASCAADAGTAVWWRFTAVESGVVYVNTEGSNFDTVLGIWTGATHPLAEIACDNDSGLGPLSWLSIDASAGESYLIRVSGFGGAEGAIVLNVTTTPVCVTQTQIPVSECEALEDFFDSTNELGWKYNDGWRASATPCDWYGVDCDAGHVSTLTLNDNWLAGQIPESFGDLTGLTEIEFSGLNLGNILSSPSNFLYGSLPASIGNLSSLTYFNADWNYISGPLPESIGNLSNLTHFNLNINSLGGPLPESLGNLSALTYLNLAINQIDGEIPESIGDLHNLEELILNWNALTGSIPKSIGNLQSLTNLDLLHNQLTGRLPESIGKLTNLKNLNLGYNSLSGNLPPTLGALNKLTRFSVSANQLGGTVPLPAAKAVAHLGSQCKVGGNDASLCVPNILPYQLLASEGYICGLPLHPFCDPIVHADAKVFLQGPYTTGAMRVDTAFSNHCPSAQPYSDSCFDGTSHEYDTPVVAASPPDSVIDWVLVTLRSGTGPESSIPASVRSAFLLANGRIVDMNGTLLAFPGVAPGPYRLVVRHRNHTSVMSADTLDTSDGLGSWDFTSAMTQAYTMGGAPMKQLNDGRFGMFACDASVDGVITAPDFNLWITATAAGASGYEQADCNLDGQVTAPDFNLWNANTTAGASSQVPE